MVWGSFDNDLLSLVIGQENLRHIFVVSDAKTKQLRFSRVNFPALKSPAAFVFFSDWHTWLRVSADWFAFKWTQLNTALGFAI